MSDIDLERRLARMERRLAVLEGGGVRRVYTAQTTTTDATVTVLYGFSTATNTLYLFDVLALGIRTDVYGNVAVYRRFRRIQNLGGTLTGSSETTLDYISEVDSTWNADFNISGTTLQFRVTGAAGQTINWQMRATVEQRA